MAAASSAATTTISGVTGIIVILLILLNHSLPADATDFVIYSDPPTVLFAGQEFTYDLRPQGYPFPPYWMKMTTDCELVIRKEDGTSEWTSGTGGLGNSCYLAVDSRGEAVVRRHHHYPAWRSGNRSAVSGEHVAILTANGGLGTYGPLVWSTPNEPYMTDSEYDPLTKDYVVYSYSVFVVGGAVVASYKEMELMLTETCNLVLWNTKTKVRFWETATYSDRHDCFVTLDAYGEMFVKHNRRDVLWRSGKTGWSVVPGFYVMVLRHDGRLAVYGPQVFGTKPVW